MKKQYPWNKCKQDITPENFTVQEDALDPVAPIIPYEKQKQPVEEQSNYRTVATHSSTKPHQDYSGIVSTPARSTVQNEVIDYSTQRGSKNNDFVANFIRKR